jgi:MFS family permease
MQGVAAALMVPGALSIITTTFSGRERSKAIGTWTAWSGVSVIVGPAIGGMLVEISWRLVYGILVPLSLVVVYLIAKAAPEHDREVSADVASAGKVDIVGALLAVPIVGGPVFSLIQGPAIGWMHPLVVGGIVVGVVAAVAFVRWERRAPRPLVPFELFGDRTFTVLNVVTFILYAALICSGVYIVLFLQQTAGYPPAAAGLASVIPMMVLFFLAKPIGTIADRFGATRLFIAGGSLIVAISLAYVMRIDADAAFLTVVLPWGLLHGLGLSLVVSPLTAGVLNSADEQHAGAASGVNNAVARVGSLFGVAIVGVIVSMQFSSALDSTLDGDNLSAEARDVVDQAEKRPLEVTFEADITSGERDVVERALSDASVDAFRVGMGTLAGLALVAAGVAFAGIKRQRHQYSAAGAGGGCLYGAHEDTHSVSP